MARKRAVRRATDSAGLLAIIKRCRVKGFGSLAAGDCATRLPGCSPTAMSMAR
jgi:hypothetical protein